MSRFILGLTLVLQKKPKHADRQNSKIKQQPTQRTIFKYQFKMTTLHLYESYQ